MKFMIVITLTFATSYLAAAAPFNVTNSSLCFCRADKDVSDGDTYQSLIASLNSLHSYCTVPTLVSFIILLVYAIITNFRSVLVALRHSVKVAYHLLTSATNWRHFLGYWHH